MQSYNIVCISDNNYVQHTAVMLASLFCTNHDRIFNIYHISFGTDQKNKEDLILLCQSYHSSITFFEEDQSQFDGLNVGKWSVIMYLKLRIPNLLPQMIERVLFLDVDMIINHPIDELYHLVLEEKQILAAAEDVTDCIEIKARLGLNFDDIYINSGVMLLDLKKWRAKEKEFPMMEFIKTVKEIIINEQDLIALYFKNQIKCLSIKWNMTTFYYFRRPLIFDKYLPDLKESRRNPYIIHFAAPIKPWYKDCQHPFAYLYTYYLRKTPWFQVKLTNFEKKNIYQKIKYQIRLFLNKIDVIKDDMFLRK